MFNHLYLRSFKKATVWLYGMNLLSCKIILGIQILFMILEIIF